MSIWMLLKSQNSPYAYKLAWLGHTLPHRCQLIPHFLNLWEHSNCLFWYRWWLFIILGHLLREAIFISRPFLLRAFSFLLFLLIHALLLPFFLLLLLLFTLQFFYLFLLRFFFIFLIIHVFFLILFVFRVGWFYL